MSEEVLHRLLPDFLLGRISEADMARFERHLDDCDECKAEKAFLGQVQAHAELTGAGAFDDHPTPDLLVAYHAGELDDDAAIRRHLNACTTCSTELRWITGEESVDLTESTTRGPAQPATPRWVVPTLAAAVVVTSLLSYALFREQPSTRIVAPQLITPIERSDGTNTILVRPGEPVELFFAVDLPDDQFPAVVRLKNESGRIVKEWSIASRSDLTQGLYTFLSCSPSDCSPGDYFVKIDGESSTAIESIPFRIEITQR